MLEEHLPGEVLVVGVLDPTRDHRLVRQPIGVLQIQQPRHQPRLCCRPPLAGRKEPGPLPLEHLPVDQRRQLHQLVLPINHVDQTRTQQVILFLRARTVLHARTEIAGFRPKSYKTLRPKARKTATFQHKINDMSVVQGERMSLR